MVDALQDKCPAADRAMAPPLRAVEDSTFGGWKGNPETENGDIYRTQHDHETENRDIY